MKIDILEEKKSYNLIKSNKAHTYSNSKTSQGWFPRDESVVSKCISLAHLVRPGTACVPVSLTLLLWQIVCWIFYTIKIHAPTWIWHWTKGLAVSQLVVPWNRVGHVPCRKSCYVDLGGVHVELTMTTCLAYCGQQHQDRW